MLETFVLQRRWHKCKQDAPSSNGDDFHPGVCISNLCLLAFLLPQHTWKWQLESSLSNRTITMLRDHWGCLKTGFCPADRRTLQESTDPQNTSSVCSFLQGVCAAEALHFCTCVTLVYVIYKMMRWVLILIRFISSNYRCDAFRLCNILNEALVKHAEGNLNHP